MTPQRRPSQQRVDPLGRLGAVVYGQRGVNSVEFASEGSVVLIQQNGGCPLGSGVGQGNSGFGADRIVLVPLGPIPPRDLLAASFEQRLLETCHGGHSPVTVQPDRIIRNATNDDSFAQLPGLAKASNHDPVDRVLSQRSRVGHAKQALDRLNRAGPLDQQRGDRAAAGGGELDDAG